MDDYRKQADGWGSKERKEQSRASKAAFRKIEESPILYVIVAGRHHFLAGEPDFSSQDYTIEFVGAAPRCTGPGPCKVPSHMDDGACFMGCTGPCDSDLSDAAAHPAFTFLGGGGEPDRIECPACGAKYEVKEVPRARA